MGPKFALPLKKISTVDILLDNNAFIAFFTSEPEDNYLEEDVRVAALAQYVRAQRSINKQTGSIKLK